MSIFSAIGKVVGGVLSPMGSLIGAAGSAIGLPDSVTNVAKMAVGVVTGNYVTVADGAIGLVGDALKSGGAKTEYSPSSDRNRCQGYAPSSPSSSSLSSSSSGSAVDPDKKLRESVSALQLYFEEINKAGNPLTPGLLTKDELIKAAKDSKLPAEVRQAARYLLDHPAVMDRLDRAKNGKLDGKISMKDLEIVMREIEKTPASNPGNAGKVGGSGGGGGAGPVNGSPHGGSHTHGPNGGAQGSSTTTTTRTTTTTTTGGSGNWGCRPPNSVRDILNNPNLSTEEKIQAVLAQIADNADAEILEVMDQMADLSSRKAGMSKEDSAKADSSMEQLQLRLQKLTERRKQMFELMSNISQKYNEMSHTAIQNLGRA